MLTQQTILVEIDTKLQQRVSQQGSSRPDNKKKQYEGYRFKSESNGKKSKLIRIKI